MIELLFFILQATTLQIDVNETTPCFLNETAGAEVWINCGFTTDYLKAALLPWEWITGGWFSMILVSLFIGITYIKYQKIIYPLAIGIIFLPISFVLFPAQFTSFAMILAIMGIGFLIAYIYIKQTKEY